MRDSYPRERTSVLVWLLSALAAVFVLQLVCIRLLGIGDPLSEFFALSAHGIRHGWVWTLLTYSFVHDSNNLLHLLGNAVGLFFLGRVLLPQLGARRFLGVYFGSVLLGGIVWLATNWNGYAPLIGASAGVMGLLALFACLYPNQPITFLLFFVFPVTIKPKHLVICVAAFEAFGFVFYELMGAASPVAIAHSAHLGGLAAGWLYHRFFHGTEWRWFRRRQVDVELPRWARRRDKTAANPAPVYHVNVSSRDDLRAEVDRILDKINSQGFGALTPEEKRLLDEAKDLLSRR
ncbi:rhomboid family intramembrane serine protease [Horticoccus luteus]|nr:rhomboid family intramembrane serine protease [Horticoccus luteus]